MLIVFGCLAGIVLLRVQAGAIDYASANVLTMVLTLVVVIALVTRLFFRRNSHWLARWLPIAGVLLAIVAAGVLLRVDRVSGRLVPKLALRWSLKPDQLLGAPAIARSDEPVDVKTTTPDDFPQFLGPQRNVVVTGIELDRDWATHPPKQLWRQPIGAAWSGFSAVNGYAMTMEQRGPEELVTCYEVATGKPRWVHAVDTRYRDGGGRSRPAQHAHDRRWVGLCAGCDRNPSLPGRPVRHACLERRHSAAIQCHTAAGSSRSGLGSFRVTVGRGKSVDRPVRRAGRWTVLVAGSLR